MQQKHTPGPWKVQRTISGAKEAIDERLSPISGKRVYDARVQSIATTHVCTSGETPDECLANARLIAAAPDLLDALGQYLLAVQARFDHEESGGPIDALVSVVAQLALAEANARAAITAATGEVATEALAACEDSEQCAIVYKAMVRGSGVDASYRLGGRPKTKKKE